MAPISAPAPFAPPDAVIALPGKGPVQSLPPASAGAGLPASAGAGPSGAPMARPEGRNRPLRNGNPRDNPNLAPGEPARGRRCHTRACHRACPGGAFDPGVDPLWAKAGSDGVGAGLGSVPGQGAQSAKPDQDTMDRETEGSDGAAAGVGPVPGPHRGGDLGEAARSTERGQDAMMSLPPGACPGGGTVRLDGVRPVPGLHQGGTPGQGARSVEREQDLMKRETVRLGAVGLAAGLRQGVTLGQGAWSVERGQDLMKRETVRSGRADAGVGLAAGLRQGVTPGRGVRSVERGHDNMPSLAPGACPGGASGGMRAMGPGGVGSGGRMAPTAPAARSPASDPHPRWSLPLPLPLVRFAAQARKGRGRR